MVSLVDGEILVDGEMVFGVNCGTTCRWMVVDGVVIWPVVMVMICTHSDEGYGTGNCLLQLFIQ